MPRKVTKVQGMSPLQALITERMREKGWEPADVEARGVKHATLHRYMNPIDMRQLPRAAVIEALAKALDLDVEDVRQAAKDSIGGVTERPWRRSLRKVTGDVVGWEVVVTRLDRLPLSDAEFFRALRDVERELSPDLIESFEGSIAAEKYDLAARRGRPALDKTRTAQDTAAEEPQVAPDDEQA